METIGDYAFNYNDLTSLDLSGCLALNFIGVGAFSSNELTSIDLSDCKALTSIGEHAFLYNALSSFILPTPKIPGYTFVNWIDGNSNTYAGVDTISNFSTSYTAILTTATDIYELPENLLKLYPNPVKDIINLQITEDALVSIMDLIGTTVVIQKVNKGHTAITVGYLKTGNYIIKVKTKNDIIIKKVMIE